MSLNEKEIERSNWSKHEHTKKAEENHVQPKVGEEKNKNKIFKSSASKISVKPVVFKHGKEASKVGIRIGWGIRDKAVVDFKSTKSKPNQAAAGDDHLVVRSLNGGRDIIRTVVSNSNKDMTVLNPLFLSNQNSMEHYGDPPPLTLKELSSSIFEIVKDTKTDIGGEALVEQEMTDMSA